MSQATELRLSGSAVKDELAAYLLGVGNYTYREGHWHREQYNRLHRAIRALGHLPPQDVEAMVLRYGAQLAQVHRVLAAIFVQGAYEAVETGSAWTNISEATLFRIALDQGHLLDYIGFANDFAMPVNSEFYDPPMRYFLFTEHFQRLPEGSARHGLRLGILSLFNGERESVAAALAVCDRLHGQDTLLHTMAAERLLQALERDQAAAAGAISPDLGAPLVAAAGRWGLTAALPHLYRMLDTTTAHDRSSRVLRALLLQAIDQLS